MRAARSAFQAHPVLADRDTVKNSFFSLMMNAEHGYVGPPKGRRFNVKFEPIRILVKSDEGEAELRLWRETIGTIIQDWSEKGWLLQSGSLERRGMVDPEKEQRLIDAITQVLTDRDSATWVADDGEGELTTDMVKSLYEMMEMYMFLTEQAHEERSKPLYFVHGVPAWLRA